jgi:phosphate-selective porin OprO/OprP
MTQKTPFLYIWTVTLLLAGFCLPAQAEAPNPVSLETAAPRETPLNFENVGLLHKDDAHPWLQEFWLLGRYHGHLYDTEGSDGDVSGFESRRIRLGFQARLFDRLTLHAQAISGSDFDPTYNGFTELWMRWKFTDAIQLTVGQQKHRFTHDRNVSSRYMSTMERTMFTNMMGLDYTPAVTLSGRVKKLDYYAGIFSNATGRDMGTAFTELNAGASLLAAATYDLGTALGTDSAHFYGSFLHSDLDPNATHLNRFNNAVSGALILTEGPAALITELTAGFGGLRGDAVGLNIQPSYFLTDTLEVVGRYQVAAARQENGLRPQRRYESPAGVFDGDFYQAVYLGLNHYLAGHRFKVMTGIEYAKMDDQDALTLFAGVRLFFGPDSSAPFPGNKMLKGRW